MSARAKRHALAAALSAVLPTVNVYASPPEQIAGGQSLVLSPARPYREASSFCSESMRLRVVATVPRTAGAPGLDELDDLLDAARAILRALPGVSWSSVDYVGLTIYAGGSELLSGALMIQVDI